MADLKLNYNTSGTGTLTIASLANGSGRASTAIDNSTNKYISADIGLKIKTNASGTSSTGYVSVYLIRSYDGTTYDDMVNAGGTYAGSDAAFTPVNALLLGTINTVANATTYYKTFDTAELGLSLPKKWAIVIVNSSGAALDSTAGSHEFKYTEKYFGIN
jgi:hypothetical protein